MDIDSDPNQLPGMNQPMYPTSKVKTPPGPPPAGVGSEEKSADPPLPTLPTSGPAKKKAKIDPALLDKVIKARAGTP